jgi:hypothetical protein
MSLGGQTSILLDSTADAFDVIVACGVVIVVLVIAGGGVMLMRRWLKSDDHSPAATGFSLTDLRQLRDSGQMSAEEYERARGKLSAAALRDRPPGKPGRAK